MPCEKLLFSVACRGKAAVSPTWMCSSAKWQPMGTKASLSSQTAASLACLHAAGACTSFWCGWKQIPCCPSRIEAWIPSSPHLAAFCLDVWGKGLVLPKFFWLTMTLRCSLTWPIGCSDAKSSVNMKSLRAQSGLFTTWRWQNLCGWSGATGRNVSNNAWYKTLTDREQDALPLLQVQSPGSLMRDLSQSINRANAFTWRAEGGKHIAPTMLPKMNLWLEPVPPRNTARLMLGREALLFQGFPALLFLERLDTFQAEAKAAGLVAQAAQQSNTKPLVKRAKHPHQVNERNDFRKQDLLLTWRPTETLMQDLAGNAMSLPVVMTMLQYAFVAVNWQSAGEVRRAADAPVTTQQDWHAMSTTI